MYADTEEEKVRTLLVWFTGGLQFCSSKSSAYSKSREDSELEAWRMKLSSTVTKSTVCRISRCVWHCVQCDKWHGISWSQQQWRWRWRGLYPLNQSIIHREMANIQVIREVSQLSQRRLRFWQVPLVRKLKFLSVLFPMLLGPILWLFKQTTKSTVSLRILWTQQQERVHCWSWARNGSNMTTLPLFFGIRSVCTWIWFFISCLLTGEQELCRFFFKKLSPYTLCSPHQTSPPMCPTVFAMLLHCSNVWLLTRTLVNFSSTVRPTRMSVRCTHLIHQIAHIPLFLYPFLNTTSKTRPFEYLRLTSLGVIGALVKVSSL